MNFLLSLLPVAGSMWPPLIPFTEKITELADHFEKGNKDGIVELFEDSDIDPRIKDKIKTGIEKGVDIPDLIMGAIDEFAPAELKDKIQPFKLSIRKMLTDLVINFNIDNSNTVNNNYSVPSGGILSSGLK